MRYNSITDVPGIKVGHAQNKEAATGCTVILCEKGAVAGVDVRGGAPGTRETDCLHAENLVSHAHAVYLGGGSAFGLDGATGVVRYLDEKGIGFDVGVAKVPIVPGAVLFDLTLGSATIRPDAAMGYAACQNASTPNTMQGTLGAATGATIGKAAGPQYIMKGGLGTASATCGNLIVGALVAVNCFGDVIDPKTGTILAGTLGPDKKSFANSYAILSADPNDSSGVFKSNTTIGVIATNARLTKAQATKVAMMAHDGFARAINPIHTLYDGDSIFCLATEEVAGDVNVIGAIAAEVMCSAIINGIKAAESLHGVPGYEEVRRRNG